MSYLVCGVRRYEEFEVEKEFDTLEDAMQLAEEIADEGGFAEVTDENGVSYYVN